MKNTVWILVLVTLSYCTDRTQSGKVDLQGHRGARGLYPENTLPGFIKAIDLGVNTLEMDLAVTRDSQLVVSHDPYLSATICLDLDGSELIDSLKQHYLIYQMDYQEVAAYDCGSKPHPRFPEQKKLSLAKPLLIQVIDSVEAYLDHQGISGIGYNIEIKSWKEYDDVLHPKPSVFSDMVYQLLDTRLSWDRVTIQSFDFRVLQYFHETYPDVRLSLLIENDLDYAKNLDSLGFYPQVYSVEDIYVDHRTIEGLHALGIQVIPWTINDSDEMKRLIDLGVDGIITDYPNRYPHN